MPIPIRIKDNESQVHVRVKDDESKIKVETGCNVDIRRLEILIEKETQDRISGDEYLQQQIDDISSKEGARYLQINQSNQGVVTISILDSEEGVLDSKEITITGKIVSSATLDINSKKLVLTCLDGSTIECDVSSILDDIANLKSRVSELEHKGYELQVEEVEEDIVVDASIYPEYPEYVYEDFADWLDDNGDTTKVYYFPYKEDSIDKYHRWKYYEVYYDKNNVEINNSWRNDCNPLKENTTLNSKCLVLKQVISNNN